MSQEDPKTIAIQEMRSALDIMQSRYGPYTEQMVPKERHSDDPSPSKDYQLCSEESKSLLQCIMSHPDRVEECDRDYSELRRCQQGLKH